jgi:hypothetical protein
MTTTRQHDCGGPVFGRLTPGCPRCDDLSAGAPPVTWNIRRRETEADMRALDAAIRAHNCRQSGCGWMCTAFQW